MLATQTWLDKLGAAARLNVSVVCRQAWMGGQYSLIQYTSFKPLPDYWASVLHKRLMGATVLDVGGSLEMGRSVRTWASCAHKKNAAAPRGAVTLLVLNTQAEDATVQPVSNGRDLLAGGWDEYLLTPADAVAGLSSPDVALNGVALGMVAPRGPSPALPELAARPRTGSALTLPGLSFGFFGACLLCATARVPATRAVWLDLIHCRVGFGASSPERCTRTCL